MPEQLLVRVAEADEVRPLRMAVLRPGWPLRPADYDGPPTRHVGAFVGSEVVGCASVFPSAYGEVPDAWQLRGMAVASGRQGSGVGAKVLVAAIDIVRDSGGSLLWANARSSALGFYERLGFKIVGPEFVHGPLELPHQVVTLEL